MAIEHSSPKNVPRVQAGEVTYELHSLGWKAFQNLCSTITAEVWGQVVEAFFDSHDGGRDGAFWGTWKPRSGESFEGSFTVQCKFFSSATPILKPSGLKDEIDKAHRLASRGLAENYILFTNAGLTGTVEESLRRQFEAVSGVKHFAAYGRERISQIIRESQRLRRLVPQVYGLGDLSQILDQRAYDQAQEILSAWGDDLGKFVITDAYRKSAKALSEHGFVLLLGEPACGKSTIAAALSLGALDEWGCLSVKVRDANDFVAHSNPHEPKQFFWVDDVFGTTQLEWSNVVDWNRGFPYLQAAIRRGARVLFTSRNYIYRSARQHLKESAFPLIAESQVIIEVENLSRQEREQILYNHVRLGTQEKKFKLEVKPFLPDVASHERFSPEIARRLGSPNFTKKLVLSHLGLTDFVSRPFELLCEIIRTLDANSRSALALVFMRGGLMTSPLQMTSDEQRAADMLGGTADGIRTALNSLEGSLLVLTLENGTRAWRFKHPTIRDAFAALIAENPELLDIYLVGVPIETLFREVSCGDVGIKGVRVIIPPNRFANVISRIAKLDVTKYENRGQLNAFLAFRCDKGFLTLYMERQPGFMSGLTVGSFLNAWSDVNVIVRLYELGLLPESKRTEFIFTIRELAVETPDSGFLQKRIRVVFTPEELADILENVRTSLIPQLDKCLEDWRVNYNSNDDPDAYFDELTDTLKDYRAEFVLDEESVARIDNILAEIDDLVGELRSDYCRSDDLDSDFGHHPADRVDTRSIFDDVDT